MTCRILWRRLLSLFSRARNDRELDDEISAHLEFATAEYEARGLSGEDARIAALRDFGGVAQTREAYRDARGFAQLESLLQDVRYAVRVLQKAPVFTTVAVLTIALGVGANGAIFSVADALVGHPLPGIDTSALAVVAIGQKAPAAAADFLDWKRANTSFADLAAYRQREAGLTGVGPAERIYAAEVTPDFFHTLGINAAIGRALLPTDSDEHVAVLAHGVWQRRFGADPSVVGRVVEVDGNPVTVVGVLQKDVEMPVPTDIWLPLVFQPGERERRDILTLRVVGRLKPTSTVESAQSEFTAIAQQLELAFPATNRNRRTNVMALDEYVQGSITRRAVFLLIACVAVVLAVASVNIAGLQLARVASRRREGMLRAALGASAWRVAQLAVVENLVLATLGGIAGVIVAAICVRLLVDSMPGEIVRLIPGFAHIAVQGRTIAFMTAITLAAGLIAGAAPAVLSARGRLVGASPPQRFRSAVVVGQIAVAVVLLAVAVAFASGQRRLLRIHEVSEPNRVVVLNVTLPTRYADDAARTRFFDSALDRIRSVGGVRLAAIGTTPPLSNNGTRWTRVDVEGREPSPLVPVPWAVDQRVSPDFLRLLGIPLRAGRGFTSGDRAGTTPVAIVSEAFARLYWPNSDAVGKRVRVNGQIASPWIQVVGVAGDVLYDWTSRSPEPVMYRAAAQTPAATSTFLVRVSADGATSAPLLVAALGAVDPLVPPYGVMSLQNTIVESFAGTSQIMAMMDVLAFLAFSIAVIGIYGVVAYAVATRTREFGVRIALGATRGAIFRLVMRGAVALSAAGVGVGAVTGAAAARAAQAMLFGTDANTATATLPAVVIVVGAITLIACCAPAHRATVADPMNSLRVE